MNFVVSFIPEDFRRIFRYERNCDIVIILCYLQ
jgi:hypothetical protein